ncbi:DNA binding protein [Curvularia clavata]|uniref:DNA binding protein n=1 Tax=Curvularia clavata TaxID=95742 RepID=A0A9Q9DS51_CURCL|nr:DNA binding protein [Curvularia clavata]
MSDEQRASHDSPNSADLPRGSASGPSPAAAAPTPNPRSCVTCRRRKVKCDKKNPCSNCVRAKIDCVFPGPGRAPRKSRKPPDAELLERLRRLEGVVTSLNAQVEGHEQEAAERQKERTGSAVQEECPFESTLPVPTHDSATAATGPTDNNIQSLEHRFGRLVVENGRSRYINNSFWANLNTEVEDLKAILIEPDDEDDDDALSPESSDPSSHHQSFIFGYNSSSVDMQSLHPPEHQARHFWEVYKESVEPLVKIQHVPTFETTLFNAFANLDKVGKGLEPLLFVVYYGAVTSSTPEECREKWGEERGTLLNRFRFGIEQGLARANFLYCDELVTLQAFIAFLLLCRRNDDARRIWTLTGLVVRIAQTLGIHRDGTHFNLPPFEVEMRRRLWWQVCILDARSSEDQGCDPTIHEGLFDTKMPLNVDDSDLHPDMTEFPQERQGFTDMTFCLLRFEITKLMRRITYVPPGPNKCTEFFANLTIEQKEKWITDYHHALEAKYLKNCDMSVPLCWVAATVSRLVMSKMWLIVYHPHQRKDGGATLPQATKDKLFISSLESIEYGLLLETEARTMKWGWLFRTYVPWHAIAFLLSELCVRTKGDAVDRAWSTLESSAGRWWFPLTDEQTRKATHGHLWKPLGKLLAKAKAARERELALQRAMRALQTGQFPGERFDFDPRRVPQQPEMASVPSTRNSPPTLGTLPQPFVPNIITMPNGEPSSWSNSPTQSNPHGVSTQNMRGMDMQRSLPNGAASGFSEGVQNLGTPAQEFRNLSRFGMDDIISDVMGGSPLAFPDYTQAISPVSNIPQSSSPQTSQPVSTAQPFVANNLPTAANGYPTFGDGMLQNTDMGFGMNSNGGGGVRSMSRDANGRLMTEGTDMDWALWDDMVSQLGTDGHSINPTGMAGPGSIGMVPWL